MNSFRFSLSGKIFLSSILKGSFARYNIIILLPSGLLGFAENSSGGLIEVPLYVPICFCCCCCCCFEDSLFIFNSWQFHFIVSQCGSLWIHLFCYFSGILNLDVCFFPQNKHSALFFSSPSETFMIHILVHFMVFHRSLHVSSFSFIFAPLIGWFPRTYLQV